MRHTLSSLGPMLAGGGNRYPLFVASFLLVSILEVAGVGLIPAFIAACSEPQALRAYAGRFGLNALAQAGEAELLTLVGAVLAGFFVLKNLALAAVTYFQAGFVASRQAALSARLLSTYLHQPYTFHLQRNSAELIRNTTGVTFNVFSGVVVPCCVVLTEGLVILMVVALLLAVSPVPTLLALVLLGAASFSFYRSFRALVRRLGERQQLESGEMIKWVSQGLGGIKEAIILGRENFFVRTYAQHIAAFSHSFTLFQSISALARPPASSRFSATLMPGASVKCW